MPLRPRVCVCSGGGGGGTVTRGCPDKGPRAPWLTKPKCVSSVCVCVCVCVCVRACASESKFPLVIRTPVVLGCKELNHLFKDLVS